jgi:hypothetical protein
MGSTGRSGLHDWKHHLAPTTLKCKEDSTLPTLQLVKQGLTEFVCRPTTGLHHLIAMGLAIKANLSGLRNDDWALSPSLTIHYFTSFTR